MDNWRKRTTLSDIPENSLNSRHNASSIRSKNLQQFHNPNFQNPPSSLTLQNAGRYFGVIYSKSFHILEDHTPTPCSEFSSPNGSTKKEKEKREEDLPIEIQSNPKLIRYWNQRNSIFHLYDKGIKLDEESWFSATPESIAKITAKRCKCDVILDPFCGAGGNAIQFAFTSNKVIAIDVDEKKIEMARHNATIYGVADRIEFIIGNYFDLAPSLKADVVFLDPPWGGPDYLSQYEYDLETLQPKPFSELLVVTKQISNNIAWFLPRNSNTHPLILASGQDGTIEIEENFVGKKLKAITVYMGNLVKSTS